MSQTLLKKGDKVVMHTCGEGTFPIYCGKIWTCRTDEVVTGKGVYEQRLVFLDGYSGSFMTKYLQLVDMKPFEAELTKEREAKNVTAEDLANKLEGYEQSAYDGGFGLDWLAEIGEGFKHYAEDCNKNEKPVTMVGLIAWIDDLAKYK